MPIPRAVARFNRYVTNPLVRLVAGWMPGFCIMRHVGRRTGRVHSIPMNVFKDGSGFVFALTYGSGTDWVKNVLASGECVITRQLRDIPLDRPGFLTEEEGMARIPLPVRLVLTELDVTEFLRLERKA